MKRMKMKMMMIRKGLQHLAIEKTLKKKGDRAVKMQI